MCHQSFENPEVPQKSVHLATLVVGWDREGPLFSKTTLMMLPIAMNRRFVLAVLFNNEVGMLTPLRVAPVPATL